MALAQNDLVDHKSHTREAVWFRLKHYALPDSRFHLDFGSFICDFVGSSIATEQLTRLECYQSAKTIFITPDNCLEELRLCALKAGKRVLMTTYAIRRGFWLLDPSAIPHSRYEYAATLDGMEKIAKPVTLANMMEKDNVLKVELLVTGTGAINYDGIRVGKGHGFFDLEWAILNTLNIVTPQTPIAAIVHDCQLLNDPLDSEMFDTACDIIATPKQIIQVSNAQKPTCGILWQRLEEGMLQSIPSLLDLRDLIASKKAIQPEP